MTDFNATRAAFYLPPDIIYLDGNSLGPLPKGAQAAMNRVLNDEWGEMVITGWNRAGWMALPQVLGNRIARLIGAEDDHVTVGDTLSIRLYQALGAAVAMTDRKVVLTDTGNFPSDLYMAQGLLETLGQGHELRHVAPQDVAASLSDEVGVLMLTQVDYRSGRMHDMATLTAQAHELGIVTVWDLAHSAGAVEVDLIGAAVDFAVGCTYKYLNGGPGSPAFLYVAPRHVETAQTVLNGWLGHADPFAFEPTYRPGPGITRMRVGTPAILQMRALEAALDIWDMTNMADIRAKSIELTERFIAGIEANCPSLTLASPRNAKQRGSQISLRFEHGYAAMQALIARGVIGDFRAPDLMRFGFTPLYVNESDVDAAVAHISEVIGQRLWDKPEYHHRNAVT
ncbi:MAG: kynureninase [Paracoccaceae bacterium]|jgi:kynureninase